MSMTRCPKCDSTNIEKGDVMSAGKVGFKSEKHKVLINSNTHSYACLDCGYIEMYVDREYLDRVKEM